MRSCPTTSPGVVAHAADDLRVETVPLREPGPRRGRGRDRVRRHLRLRPALLDARRGRRVDPAGADGARSRGGRHRGRGGGRRQRADRAAPGSRCTRRPRPATGSPATPPTDRTSRRGCTYLGSAARFPHTDGAFVKYATLPTRMLRTLPDGVDLRDRGGWSNRPRWPGTRVSRAGERDGQVGPGDRGRADRRARRRGAQAGRRRRDHRRRPARSAAGESPAQLGATRTLLGTEVDEIAAVQADVVVDSSGSHRGLASAIRGAARGGRVVMVGLLPSGDQPVPISLAITRELELVGVVPLQRRDRRGDRRPGRRQPVGRPGGHPRVRGRRRPGGVRRGQGRLPVVEGAAAVRDRSPAVVSGSCRCSLGSRPRRPSR